MNIEYHGRNREIHNLIAVLPAILSGRVPDPYGIARGLQLRIANAVLSQIQQDFIRKARGGTGLDGIKWAPLQRATIAGRRTTRGERKAAGISEKEWKTRQRGLLSPEQNQVWKRKFARSLAWLRLDMPEDLARKRAAQIAWNYVREEMGAKTLPEVFGGRDVEILRDTGELFRSLAAGVEDEMSEADGQIVRIPTGTVIVGTDVKPWHHRGVPGKLPARPLWPLNGEIPAAWWPAIHRAVIRGLTAIVKNIIEQRAIAPHP